MNQTFKYALEIMGKGMLSIFIVIVLLMLIIMLLAFISSITAKKKGAKQD